MGRAAVRKLENYPQRLADSGCVPNSKTEPIFAPTSPGVNYDLTYGPIGLGLGMFLATGSFIRSKVTSSS